MKKIPICGVLHRSEKKKENPTVWNTGKKMLNSSKNIIKNYVI